METESFYNFFMLWKPHNHIINLYNEFVVTFDYCEIFIIFLYRIFCVRMTYRSVSWTEFGSVEVVSEMLTQFQFHSNNPVLLYATYWLLTQFQFHSNNPVLLYVTYWLLTQFQFHSNNPVLLTTNTTNPTCHDHTLLPTTCFGPISRLPTLYSTIHINKQVPANCAASKLKLCDICTCILLQ